MKTETLSDKILFVDVRDFFGLVREGRKADDEWTAHMLPTEDVKDFIQKLKEDFKNRIQTNTDVRDIDEGTLFDWEVDDIISKRAGDALVHSPQSTVNYSKEQGVPKDTPEENAIKDSSHATISGRSESSGTHSQQESVDKDVKVHHSCQTPKKLTDPAGTQSCANCGHEEREHELHVWGVECQTCVDEGFAETCREFGSSGNQNKEVGK